MCFTKHKIQHILTESVSTAMFMYLEIILWALLLEGALNYQRPMSLWSEIRISINKICHQLNLTFKSYDGAWDDGA